MAKDITNEVLKILEKSKEGFKTNFAKRGIEVIISSIRIEQKNIETEELESAVSDYYSNLPCYKSLALKVGLVKKPITIEAYEEVLSYRLKHKSSDNLPELT